MVASIAGSMAGITQSLETKLTLYIVIFIVAVVIVNNLIDGIRSYIRGLDSAVLGGIFLYLAHRASDVALVKPLTGLLTLIGATLVITGLVIFIVTRAIKAKFRSRSAEREWDPKIEKKEKKAKKTEQADIEESAEQAEPEAQAEESEKEVQAE